ncbi:duf227 domain containing protein [Grosmannia clavigera kw1407]|uniref:Duf227 domain containing protein n=1 Tax=Grosmannia clavigera (strain kw1407 / UAMH 11150) TaxID=655863 RepID=F0XNR9_GROCL|nr:duf227 domain containing protein [Grosmannia clavigera kw1407]EFX00569.1 duf227 domain containing protein [Grosmannia clavigera kw1407]
MASNDNLALVMPNTHEEVTLSWLQAILDDKTISAFNMTDKRMFETTSKLYITLSYDGQDAAADAPAGKPKHILLKGGFSPAMFATPGYKALLLRVFTQEVDFFNGFVSTLPADSRLQVPKVWWAAASPDQAILAMEDLRQAGFVFGDPTRTYGLASALSGVEQLAALHAATWAWTGSEHAWLASPMYDVTMRSLFAMWEDLILADGRPVLPGIIRDDRARTNRAMETYLGSRNPRFRCLVHGDPHSGNTYLNAQDESKVRFLDWQIVHVGTAFHDVAYFVTSMLTIEDRRAHEWTIIEHYLAALASAGGPALTVDDPEVRLEYRKAQFTGLGWMLTPYAMQSKERVVAIVARYAAAIVDHKTIELLSEEPQDA